MIVIVFIIYWRVFRLRESAVWAASKKRDRDQLRETMLLFQHFWHRWAGLCLPLQGTEAILLLRAAGHSMHSCICLISARLQSARIP